MGPAGILSIVLTILCLAFIGFIIYFIYDRSVKCGDKTTCWFPMLKGLPGMGDKSETDKALDIVKTIR